MKYKVAVYCSGSASRIIKFYEEFSSKKFELDLIFYEGEQIEIIQILEKICKKVVVFSNQKQVLETNLSDELYSYLEFYKIDFVFCFGSSILKGEILKRYKYKIINFHPSLLPSFPGLNAIDQALKTSVKFLGNTAHFIDEGIDTGPIIMQTIMRRDCFENYDDVLDLQIDMIYDIWILINQQLLYVEEDRVFILRKSQNSYFKSI